MNISGYGASYNYSGYGVLLNKAKTPAVSTAITGEKPKPESKDNNTTNVYDPFKVKGYDPFKDMFKTGSVSLPSWVYTKTEPTRSDKEILKDMAELAKKHAEQGTFQNNDYEFQSLMKEYVSSASPDRENILKNTVNEINGKIKISDSHKNRGKKEAFDPIGKLLEVFKNMEKGENKVTSDSNETRASVSGGINGVQINNSNNGHNGAQIVFNMEGANYHACVENGDVKAAMIRDSNGEVVMLFDERNSSGQLSITMSGTEREGRRSAELLKAYNETYKEVSSSKGIVSGNSFDAVG
jgi:predicted RND superfamily exporter protein